MGYRKAADVLPPELIEMIQQYIDGETLYIPKKNARQNWGSGTCIREELFLRNVDIYESYQNGAEMKALAERYFLSEKSIQRIIRMMKKELQQTCLQESVTDSGKMP